MAVGNRLRNVAMNTGMLPDGTFCRSDIAPYKVGSDERRRRHDHPQQSQYYYHLKVGGGAQDRIRRHRWWPSSLSLLHRCSWQQECCVFESGQSCRNLCRNITECGHHRGMAHRAGLPTWGGEPIGGVHPVSESSMATNNWSSSVSACVIRGDTGENLGAHRHVRFFLLSSKCVLIAEALLPNTSLGAQTGCGGGLPSCFVRLALSPT